jgi:hypothetical protein
MADPKPPQPSAAPPPPPPPPTPGVTGPRNSALAARIGQRRRRRRGRRSSRWLRWFRICHAAQLNSARGCARCADGRISVCVCRLSECIFTRHAPDIPECRQRKSDRRRRRRRGRRSSRWLRWFRICHAAQLNSARGCAMRGSGSRTATAMPRMFGGTGTGSSEPSQ